MELKPDGGRIAVTQENVIEYIYLFVEARMLGNHLKCLEVRTLLVNFRSALLGWEDSEVKQL